MSDVGLGVCRPLLVLNDDTVICEDSYEPSGLDIDPGRVPFGGTTIGVCERCGAVGADGRQPTSVVVYDEERGETMLVHVDEAPLWGRSEGRDELDHPNRRVAGCER